MQRHQLDGDIGNGGGIGREASLEEIEIGQSAGIEFSFDGLGEFGLAPRTAWGASSFNCAGTTPQAPWTKICITKAPIPSITTAGKYVVQ